MPGNPEAKISVARSKSIRGDNIKIEHKEPGCGLN
jgi:hypothetical protein